MYANNLFTLNNIPTLSVGAGFSGKCNANVGDSYPIHGSDVVFVSAVQLGSIVLEKRFTGFSNIESLMAEVCRCLSHTVGFVMVSVRSRDCGWMMKRNICVNRRSVSMFAAAMA